MIVRHGHSKRNEDKDAAKRGKEVHSFGSGLRDMDTELTPRGHRQAQAVGEHLAKQYSFDTISKMTHKPLVVEEERIREIEFGILDGLMPKGIKVKFPEEDARREREGKYWYRPPGGESRPDVALRGQSFLGTLSRDYRQKSVLIVCHSVVVLVFRRLLERWGETDYLKVDREADVLNCSLTIYEYDCEKKKLVLNGYNTICCTDSDSNEDLTESAPRIIGG